MQSKRVAMPGSTCVHIPRAAPGPAANPSILRTVCRDMIMPVKQSHFSFTAITALSFRDVARAGGSLSALRYSRD